jgi:multicomponent Na+:H+ antiporter subunit E
MSYVTRTYHALRLFVVFLWDLLTSSIQVAHAVISPRDITRPRLVIVPLEAKSDLEVTLVANFISLTPGTLTVDVGDDRRTLLVHDLFAGDSGDHTRQGVREGIETRVIRVTRP